MAYIKNSTHITGKRVDYVQVEVELEEMLETLKRELFRPLDINFTAHVGSNYAIKIWEDDYRNGQTEEPYKVTDEQDTLIRAFSVVKDCLEDMSCKH